MIKLLLETKWLFMYSTYPIGIKIKFFVGKHYKECLSEKFFKATLVKLFLVLLLTHIS